MMAVKKDKKTKKWYARVSYKVAPGEYKQKSKTGFDTKKEAEIWEAETKLKLEKGIPLQSEAKVLSFADYFEDWVDTYKIDKGLAPSTEKRYLLNVHLVKKHFGHKPLAKITRKDYQQFLDLRGKDRGKDTVVKSHSSIRQAVKDALFDGLIDYDFTHRAVISYDIEESRGPKAWSKEEFSVLLNTLKSKTTADYTSLYLCGLTGLRIGEAFGLAWKDIDFNKKTLSVKRSYDFPEKTFSKGKTKSSLRTISLNDELVQHLKTYKFASQKLTDDYIFLDHAKNPLISRAQLLRRLQDLCKELDINVLTIHSLRHTHASLLLYEGLDVQYVSKRLGHARITETMETYAHILDEMQDEQTSQLENVLDGLAEDMSAK